MQLFTIGHSAHSFERLLALLKMHDIRIVADVRSAPASRFYPQFRKQALARALEREGLRYVFLGQVLGGRPTDPICYAHGRLPDPATKPWPKPNFAAMMQRAWFREGIEQLIEYGHQASTVILCSEENPAACHRHLLIAEYLLQSEAQIEVLHLRGDGRLEHAAALRSGNTAQTRLFAH